MMFNFTKRLLREKGLPNHETPDFVQSAYARLAEEMNSGQLAVDYRNPSFKAIDALVQGFITKEVEKLETEVSGIGSVQQEFPDPSDSLTFGQLLVEDVFCQRLGIPSVDPLVNDNDYRFSMAFSRRREEVYDPFVGDVRSVILGEIPSTQKLDPQSRSALREERRERSRRGPKSRGTPDPYVALKNYAREWGLGKRLASRVVDYVRRHDIGMFHAAEMVRQISSRPSYESTFKLVYAMDISRTRNR